MRPGTANTQPGATPSRTLFNNNNNQGGSSSSSSTLPRVSTAPNTNNSGRVGFVSSSSNDNNPFLGGGFDNIDLSNTTNLEGSLSGGERTPLSSAIDNALLMVKQCEANAASLTERLAELQQNLIKSKQLESEMGPRETETKNVVAAFQRLVDVGTKMKKGSGGGKRGGGGAGDSDHDGNHRDDVSESQISRSEVATEHQQDAGNNNKTSNQRRRFGINLPGSGGGAGGSGKDGELTRDEIADRDVIRHLSHKIRHLLTPVFSDVFFMDNTQRETQKAAYLQQQAEEQAAREALLLQQQQGGGNEKASSRASRRAAQQQQQLQHNNNMKGGANNGAGGGAGFFNPLVDRLDPELYLIPGIDPSFFQDLLNLRQSRLSAEKSLKKTQDQLSQAQSIVAKRRNDGSNKAALRKAERQLQQAHASLRELQRQKEEREIRRRLEAAAAADASNAAQQQQQLQQGGGGSGMGASGSRRGGPGSSQRPPANKRR